MRRVANLETLYARAGKVWVALITSVEEFVELAERASEADRERLRWQAAEPHVWLQVLKSRPDLKDAVVLNKTLPAEVLKVLSRDEDPRIRSLVARKRSLPAELQEVLAADSDEGVRASVAWNQKTAINLLKKLTEDPWEETRKAARETLRQRTPPDGQLL